MDNLNLNFRSTCIEEKIYQKSSEGSADFIKAGEVNIIYTFLLSTIFCLRRFSMNISFRKGCRALQEVKHYQRTTHLLISKSPFTRLIKEILNPEWSSQMYNITPDAISALQEVFFHSQL